MRERIVVIFPQDKHIIPDDQCAPFLQTLGTKGMLSSLVRFYHRSNLAGVGPANLWKYSAEQISAHKQEVLFILAGNGIFDWVPQPGESEGLFD